MKNYSELSNYPPFTHGPNYGLVQGLIGPIARVNEQPLYQLSVTEDHVNEVLVASSDHLARPAVTLVLGSSTENMTDNGYI